MNLKKLALKIYSDEEKTLEIDVQGEGNVTAGDLTHDSDVEVYAYKRSIVPHALAGETRSWVRSC